LLLSCLQQTRLCSICTVNGIICHVYFCVCWTSGAECCRDNYRDAQDAHVSVKQRRRLCCAFEGQILQKKVTQTTKLMLLLSKEQWRNNRRCLPKHAPEVQIILYQSLPEMHVFLYHVHSCTLSCGWVPHDSALRATLSCIYCAYPFPSLASL